jgi:hypothetical protein
MRCRRLFVPFLIIVLTALALCPTAAGQAPTLQGATFFGGAGDQRGTAAAILNNQIYVGGSGVIGGYWSGARLVRYSIPPGAPLGSTTLPTHTYFEDLTPTAESVYAVGNARPPTCGATDLRGDTEDKSVLAQFDADDGAFVSCQSPKIFPGYDGGETFSAVQTLMESGSPMIYAAGAAETCGWGYASFVLYKYDASGGFINRASVPDVSWGQCIGHSHAFGIATLNGYLYLVGRREPPPSPFYDDYHPFVMKYDSALTVNWSIESTDTLGEFTAATDLGGYVYAVGATETFLSPASRDYLIEKYDESSNRVWRQTSGTAGEDGLTGIVAVGDRLFAVGYTTGAGSGGADMVILEIDPGTGATLSTTYYGGTLDDFARGAATDGTDLYVAGESRSFASAEGNIVGQNDMVLLRYSIVPPNEPPVANAGADQTVECEGPAGASVTLDGSASSDPDNDPLTYTWTGPFGTASGVSPTVTLPYGTSTVSLVVNDGTVDSLPDSADITIQDTTPPALTLAESSVTVVLPSAAASGASVDILAASGASATDICCDSGVTLSPSGASDYPIGTTTAYITASDCHANTSAGQPFTVNVLYNFSGFLPPIRTDGSSVFRSGRTIPVKFQLTAADGSIVSNATATLLLAQVSGTVIGSFEEITPEAAGNSNFDNLFRYDPTSGQYIYNLQAKGFATGTYVIRAHLDDGTDHGVYVSIR